MMVQTQQINQVAARSQTKTIANFYLETVRLRQMEIDVEIGIETVIQMKMKRGEGEGLSEEHISVVS